MTFGSLFAGIGGLDLGLERAGMVCKWQVEKDEYCRRVLEKHWPHVERFEDVTKVGAAELTHVDLICGGFPCQSVSQAARNRNVAPWLWPGFARMLREIRPRFAIMENVEGLLSKGRGFSHVLTDVAEVGMDAWWAVLPAGAFGAPHLRPRVWMVAYANGDREPAMRLHAEASRMQAPPGSMWNGGKAPPGGFRVDDGVSSGVDRSRALGNAVVPQVAEWLGKSIMEAAAP